MIDPSSVVTRMRSRRPCAHNMRSSTRIPTVVDSRFTPDLANPLMNTVLLAVFRGSHPDLERNRHSSRFRNLYSRCAEPPPIQINETEQQNPDESVWWSVQTAMCRPRQRVPSHVKPPWPESSSRLGSCSRRLRGLQGRGRRSVPGPVTERRRAKPGRSGGIALAQLL